MLAPMLEFVHAWQQIRQRHNICVACLAGGRFIAELCQRSLSANYNNTPVCRLAPSQAVPLELRNTVTLSPKNGVHLTVHDRT